MLAAVAWPVQEWMHPVIADVVRARNVLDATGGKILNPTAARTVGGFHDQPECAAALALAIVIMAAAETKDVLRRSAAGLTFNEYSPESIAGDLKFDPLGISKDLSVCDKYELQEGEMNNGRIAMLALASYAVIEASTDTRIVDFALF